MNQWLCYINIYDYSCSLHYLDMCFLAEVIAAELLRRFTAAVTPFLCWFRCTVHKITIFGLEASRVRAHLRRWDCMRAKGSISRAASKVLHTRKQCFKLQDVGYIPNCQWMMIHYYIHIFFWEHSEYIFWSFCCIMYYCVQLCCIFLRWSFLRASS